MHFLPVYKIEVVDPINLEPQSSKKIEEAEGNLGKNNWSIQVSCQ